MNTSFDSLAATGIELGDETLDQVDGGLFFLLPVIPPLIWYIATL